MTRLLRPTLLLLSALLGACASNPKLPPIPRAAHVDLPRFMGDWYVIAFTPTFIDKDGHNHKVTPKGGRLLEKTEPHAEFVVEKDRSVTINFYNEEMKPVAATTQTVTVIADAKSGKATLQFEKKGDTLVSKTKLPEGDGYNIVVQFKQTADAISLAIGYTPPAGR